MFYVFLFRTRACVPWGMGGSSRGVPGGVLEVPGEVPGPMSAGQKSSSLLGSISLNHQQLSSRSRFGSLGGTWIVDNGALGGSLGGRGGVLEDLGVVLGDRGWGVGKEPRTVRSD